MGFWYAIAVFFAVVFAIGAVYLTSRFYKFQLFRRISGDKKWLRILLSFILVAAIAGISYLTMGLMNAILVILHLMIFWLLCELVFFIVRKLKGIPRNGFRRYYAGAAAILVTAAYLGTGFYLAHHVWQTQYQLSSEKLDAPLRVAMFADSHVGATFHGEGFAEHMAELQKAQPDLLIIAGDYVDDDTTKEDMIRCCQALGELKTKYGIFYSLGNHDRGYYQYRNFTGEELLSELEKQGVIILRDEVTLVDDSFYIIGRRDKSESTPANPRMEMSELVKGLDPSKYMIVIDHQPTDYEAQAASKVDLVLSGHTHGGQLLGMNWAMELLGENDMLKGIRKTDDTTFIVTSGISDWAIKFKTGCKSEVVVIDINREQ